MKDSTKKVLLIGGSILVLGGIGYYFYYTSKKKKEKAAAEAAAAATAAAEAAALAAQQQQQGGGSTPSGGGGNLSAPTELNTTDKIKAFQDWMDSVGNWVKNSSGKYVKLNKGTGYGNYGPSTQAAWSAYGKQYLNSLTSTSDYEQIKNNVKEAIEKSLKDGSQYLIISLSSNRYIEFYKNGRFVYGVYVPQGGQYVNGVMVNTQLIQQALSRGTYSKAGRKFIVSEGNKKGSTFETSSLWDSVKLLK